MNKKLGLFTILGYFIEDVDDCEFLLHQVAFETGGTFRLQLLDKFTWKLLGYIQKYCSYRIFRSLEKEYLKIKKDKQGNISIEE